MPAYGRKAQPVSKLPGTDAIIPGFGPRPFISPYNFPLFTIGIHMNSYTCYWYESSDSVRMTASQAPNGRPIMKISPEKESVKHQRT
jgi:hypothetical protein